jgi:hypothetical protein
MKRQQTPGIPAIFCVCQILRSSYRANIRMPNNYNCLDAVLGDCADLALGGKGMVYGEN